MNSDCTSSHTDCLDKHFSLVPLWSIISEPDPLDVQSVPGEARGGGGGGDYYITGRSLMLMVLSFSGAQKQMADGIDLKHCTRKDQLSFLPSKWDKVGHMVNDTPTHSKNEMARL